MSLITLHPDTQTFLARSPHKLLIGGKWVAAKSGATYQSINPSDGTLLAELASAGVDDVEEAVKAARRAFEDGWGEMLPRERERLLRSFADLIAAHAEELAELESLDNGKPIRNTRAIDSRAAANLVYHLPAGPVS